MLLLFWKFAALNKGLAVSLVVLRLEGQMLCLTDEVGEICVSSIGTGSGYYGLAGRSESVFKVRLPDLKVSILLDPQIEKDQSFF